MSGVDGNEEPYYSVLRFYCINHFPPEWIAASVLAAIRMTLLIDQLADGVELTKDEKTTAIRLLQAGKSIVDVVGELRKTNPKIKVGP